MNLSQIRVAARRRRPCDRRKNWDRISCNDQNLARWMSSRPRSVGRFVLEIGPGLGALTSEILKRGARAAGVGEMCRLGEFFARKIREPRSNCTRRWLDFDRRMLFAERNVKLIGTFRIDIASQLLCRFVDFPNCISLALFMLQN